MLLELSVRELGVIEDLRLVFGTGMTALTGETGAGKTLLVEALELVVGARGDPTLVRPGAPEAWIEARFAAGEDETILVRVLPAGGRSRAYRDGHMVPVSGLAEAAAELVDLHGQHAHQSLLTRSAQRAALDAFGGVDLTALDDARAAVTELDAALAAIGGDPRARAREIDLLRFQVDELDRAGLADPDEDAFLALEEDALADAVAHREAGAAAVDTLAADGGAVDAVGAALAAIAGRGPYVDSEIRLRSLAAEVADVATDLRAVAEAIAEDPERLASVRARRQLLRDLERKYGPTIEDVIAYAEDARRRLADLESYEDRAVALERQRNAALNRVSAAEAEVGRARRTAAPALAAVVEEQLRRLAMPAARFEVEVGADPGDDVMFLLGANPGEPTLPLTKVASGGELARTMLAARLVLTHAPPTLVFDEVDAGIGGEAAVAVGRALAELASDHQVLVVTHLPQVAAFADHQISVTKAEVGGRTVARAEALDDTGRVVELSRMLSGQPDSATARGHAEELLAGARAVRSGTRNDEESLSMLVPERKGGR